MRPQPLAVSRPAPVRPVVAFALALALALALVAACGMATSSAPAGSGPAEPAAATGTVHSSVPPSVRPGAGQPAPPPASSPPASPASAPPTPHAPAAPARPWARPVVARTLQLALEDARTRLRIPGVQAAVVFPDGTDWTGSSGLADVAAGVPVTDDTAFSVASISKTFLAALVLELAAEGAFRLEDPIDRLVPGLDLGRGITVRMLLDHTSGLHDYFLHPRIDRALQGRPSRQWSAERALRYVGKPYFAPGTGWHYSNTNYLVLGLLVERATGRSVAEHLRERFFDPLGLEHAYYQLDEPPAGALAHGYRLSGRGARTRAVDLADDTGIAPFRSVVSAAGAAGSVAASARDVARWARALYGGSAISDESLSLMLSGVDRVAGYRPRIPYGLGVQAVTLDGHPTFGHSGRFLGFRAVMRWLPEEGIAIAVLTNQSRSDPALIAARLVRIVLPDPRPVPASRPH